MSIAVKMPMILWREALMEAMNHGMPRKYRMKRTPLSQRQLPNYTRKNEALNLATHAFGAVLGILVLVLGTVKAARQGDAWAIVGNCIFGASMTVLYSVSSVYHGLKPSMGKKVMQVVDHCTIYLLIAGTYTPILLCAIRPEQPVLAWIVFGCEWAAALAAAAFTAIDLHKYSKLSMLCYIVMGWMVILVLRPTIQALTIPGFLWLLGGGLAYTIGAVFYGIGHKKPTVHTIFHLFVDLGSILHSVCIFVYVI